MKFRIWFLRLMTPVQKIMQKIGNPEPTITASTAKTIFALAAPGDVILSRENWRLTNIFVPGYWGHIALVVNDNMVIEAIGSGVRFEDLARFVYQKDSIALLRPLFANKEQREMAASFGVKTVGKKYDFEFEPNENAFYCGEVITWVYQQVLAKSPFTLRKTMGVETAPPQDFYDAKEKWINLIEERNDV